MSPFNCDKNVPKVPQKISLLALTRNASYLLLKYEQPRRMGKHMAILKRLNYLHKNPILERKEGGGVQELLSSQTTLILKLEFVLSKLSLIKHNPFISQS